MKEHNDKLECKFCGHQFDSKAEMKNHAMKKHPEMLNKE